MRTTGLSQKTLWITVACGAGIVAYVFLVFLPAGREISRLRDRLESRRQTVLAGESLLSDMALLERDVAAAREFTERWSEHHRTADFATFYATVHEAAAAANVRIIRCEPETVAPLRAVVRLPVHLEAEGTYAGLLELVRQLESSPRAPHVRRLTIHAGREEAAPLRCEIHFAVFADRNDFADHFAANVR